ncbi:hypothetical protein N7513_007093 [Penicillium frequentans]|nr:hypothetical protein N7513_007093 [Penicillium glabrum]
MTSRSSSVLSQSHDANTNASFLHGAPTAPTKGLLVEDGTSTRYANEFLFSRGLEKESELQSAIDPPVSTNNSEASFMIGFDGLISKPQSAVDTFSLFPSRGQATHLWQMYLNNVDVLLKVLHIPTTQSAVFAAINNPNTASQDLNALLFSIYFAAVTSLRQAEINLIFGEDRQAVLKTFQRGLEIFLHSAEFLDSPTIVSLQAMSIYLLCYRNHNCGRSGWTLNGVLLRTAQWMGLHRDGERSNLPPLECEIRRRLWYQIIGCDARAGEDHALSTNGYGGFSDTKLPLNIDDRDISPNMEVAPTSKSQWTEMTLFLIAAEMSQAHQKMSRLSTAVLNGDEKMTSLEQLLETITTRINNRYLQHCDPNIPIQKSALLLGQVLMGKLGVFVRQQYLRGLSAEESASRASEQTLLLACDTIEIDNELKTDELLSNFHWLFSTFTEYHLLTYILWHLCVRPGVHCADRAWQLVDKSFNLVENPSWPNPGPKWNVLRKLREKVFHIRCSFSTIPLTSTRLSNNTVPEIFGHREDELPGDAIPSSVLGIEDVMNWD